MRDRVVRLKDVAAIYGVSTRTIRRMVAANDGRVAAPWGLFPLRWRQSDIDRHLRRHSVADDVRRRYGATA